MCSAASALFLAHVDGAIYSAPVEDGLLRLTGGPGNAYKFQAPEEHHERKDVLAAQAFVERT